MSRLSIAFACLALAFVAGCGGDDEPDTAAQATPSAAAEADLGAIKAYLLEHTEPAERLGRPAAEGRAGVLRPRQGVGLRLREHVGGQPSGGRRRGEGDPGRPHQGQPGLRGDGGRRRGRPGARRLRRDHRRGRRQVRPRERRPVLARDAERAQVRAAGQLLRAGRDLRLRHRAEVHRQGRRARPRRRRQGRRSPRRCRTPTSCSPRRPTSPSTRRSSTSRPRSGSPRWRTRSRPWS